jgi:dienelactone hydrolase
MRLHSVVVLAVLLPAFAQQSVTFPDPGQKTQVEADVYGSGTQCVILAHGGRFTKESWKKQAQILADSGFAVLAIRFRGDSINPDGSPNSAGSPADNADDVLAAVTYLYRKGATTVSAVGASLGGDAVGEANAKLTPGRLSRIVILGSSGGSTPEKLTGRKLFIVARDDKSASGLRLPEIKLHYERAPEPKKLMILDGSAHAQFLFDTDQGPSVMNQIVRFLRKP